MDRVYKEKSGCCGCTACESACPARAISMRADAEGFAYPLIDAALCTDCGACRRICPFLREDACRNASQPVLYAACHRNTNVLEHSTSGGAFTALSDVLLKEHGVVYGACFDETFTVRHMRAETRAERDRMRISKYAQSAMGGIFEHVKRDVRQGRPVLFTGTPCQVGGLRGYLGKTADAPNVILCDVICHSVPSPLIWAEYRALLGREHGAPVTDVWFRTKRNGWSRSGSNRGFTYRVAGSDALYSDNRFYALFFSEQCMMRPCCEHCPYTSTRRAGDITIADYWGIEKYSEAWAGVNGVSSVFISTEKGAALFEKAKPALRFEQRPLEEQVAEQGRLSCPIVFPKEKRAAFWALYASQGFDGVAAFLKETYGA